jgi:hypothetical protein
MKRPDIYETVISPNPQQRGLLANDGVPRCEAETPSQSRSQAAVLKKWKASFATRRQGLRFF